MNKESFTKFYRDNIIRLYKYFYTRTLNKDLSEDLSTETFIDFAETVLEKSVNIENFEKYLFGIARNKFNTFLRNNYDNNNVESFDFELVSDETEEYNDSEPLLEDRILIFIKVLPEAQKRIVYLRFIEKLTLKEICEKIGKDMNYVKTTQKRAIASLKKLIECTPT